MLTLELRRNIRKNIGKFKNNLADTSELEILGWIEICHTANYIEGAYQLNKLLKEKKDEQRNA